MKRISKAIGAGTLLLAILCAVVFYLGSSDLNAAKTIESAVTTPAQGSNSAEASAAPVTQRPEPTPSASPQPTPEAEKPQYVSLLFAGDVMAHEKQISRHRFGSAYDFSDDYKYIAPIISAADIALANLETPLSGRPSYEGWPYFNAPDSLADALCNAGFDIIATANNHIRDQNDGALRRTCEFLHSKGLGVIGTASKAGDPKYALVEKNGIRIGFVNYTRSLNTGFPKESEPFVNCLKYGDKFDRGYERLGQEIGELKEKGAEFIVAFMHWGSEYELSNNSVQQDMAKEIADLGADLIIGAHPHVLQNVAEYASPKTGKNVLIYYSLGNFVSNQPYRYGPGGGNCETGALALIRLKRAQDGAVAIDSAGFLTTYVHKPGIVKEYSQGGKTYTKRTQAYYIVPAKAVLSDPALYEKAEGLLLSHIGRGAENGEHIMGKSGSGLLNFHFQEYPAFPW